MPQEYNGTQRRGSADPKVQAGQMRGIEVPQFGGNDIVDGGVEEHDQAEFCGSTPGSRAPSARRQRRPRMGRWHSGPGAPARHIPCCRRPDRATRAQNRFGKRGRKAIPRSRQDSDKVSHRNKDGKGLAESGVDPDPAAPSGTSGIRGSISPMGRFQLAPIRRARRLSRRPGPPVMRCMQRLLRQQDTPVVVGAYAGAASDACPDADDCGANEQQRASASRGQTG